MTLERGALAGLVISTAAIGAAYAAALIVGTAPGWAPWSMAMGIAGSVVSLMVLGASREGRIGSLAYPFAGVFVVLAGGFGTVLALPAHPGPEAPLWLGLPPRAAILLYGIGGLLLLFVPVSYAATFDRLTLDDADWDRIRRSAPDRPSEARRAGAAETERETRDGASSSGREAGDRGGEGRP